MAGDELLEWANGEVVNSGVADLMCVSSCFCYL